MARPFRTPITLPDGTDLAGIDDLGGTTTARAATAAITDYPIGTSSFGYTADASWAFTYGTVVTVHEDVSGVIRGFQINFDGSLGHGQFAVRRWVVGTSSWGPWQWNGSGMATDAVAAADPITSYPIGVSSFATTAAGWAEGNPGVVETVRGSNDFSRQVWSCMAHSPPDVFARRWVTGTSSWSGWTAAF